MNTNLASDVDIFLEHFGVKGMRWGVRREEEGSGSSSGRGEKAKQVAVAGGILVGAVALAAGSYYVSQHSSGSAGTLSQNHVSKGKSYLDDMQNEPIGIIHASRGKNQGFQFYEKGGIKDPLTEWEKGLGENAPMNSMRRYGTNNEKVAARFMDPEGRKDRAGRPISHDVIIPKSLAKDIKTIDDVKRIWPQLKKKYGDRYAI